MRVLIVGPLHNHATQAAHIALKTGAKVTHVLTLEEALNALRNGRGADVVLLDVLLNVPHFIKALEQEHFAVPVVACGVNADPKRAGEAIEGGAREYLPLPPDPELIAAVLNAVATEDAQVIYSDPKMQNVFTFADKIAPSEANVFITGESGTGKEIIARYIHQKSKRCDKPFVSINCAAIPENLLESELFGHEKGAFTGAIARRIGKFEEANGGTLLLDEISEMDPRLQAKLLRAIQEKVIDRVGGSHPVHVNIRILATSNRDMLHEVSQGRFREDLYFRLNVVNLKIPPLRERPLDIAPLAEHFIKKYCEMNHVTKKKLSTEACEAMKQYPWRGNVRELENTIHRAVLLSDTYITPHDLFEAEEHNAFLVSHADDIKPEDPHSVFIGRTVADVEKDLIIGTLHHCLGNRTHAANILGISIRTLRNKLKEYSESGLVAS
jgi:DNA-binding NtrC family response regulator